jgi:hypothetical protein
MSCHKFPSSSEAMFLWDISVETVSVLERASDIEVCGP